MAVDRASRVLGSLLPLPRKAEVERDTKGAREVF